MLLQVLCCEVDGIFDTLVQSEDLLSHLFSILEQQRPLVSTRAGYFARVLSSLLAKCSAPVMQFVRGKDRDTGDWHQTHAMYKCMVNCISKTMRNSEELTMLSSNKSTEFANILTNAARRPKMRNVVKLVCVQRRAPVGAAESCEPH